MKYLILVSFILFVLLFPQLFPVTLKHNFLWAEGWMQRHVFLPVPLGSVAFFWVPSKHASDGTSCSFPPGAHPLLLLHSDRYDMCRFNHHIWWYVILAIRKVNLKKQRISSSRSEDPRVTYLESRAFPTVPSELEGKPIIRLELLGEESYLERIIYNIKLFNIV